MSSDLQRLEMEAYTAVLRALSATPMDWNKEKLLTELRKELHVSQESHYEVLNSVMTDPEIIALRQALAAGGGAAPSSKKPKLEAAASIRPPPSAASLPPPAAPSGRPSPAPAPSAKGRLGRKQSRKPEVALAINGGAFPQGKALIGRKVWRYWPGEGVNGWVEGIITDYNADSGDHIITYDAGSQQQTYEYYNFSLAEEADYKLIDGPAVDVRALQPPPSGGPGSAGRGTKRKAGGGQGRERERGGPPPQAAAAVPFEANAFAALLGGGSAEVLATALVQLCVRERELGEELAALEDEVLDPVHRLERRLQRLQQREAAIQSQLIAVE